MQTLIIYDETGYILSIRSGQPAPREPVGVPFMWFEVPKGKRVASIDVSVTPHQPILEDVPPSEIDILKAENEANKQAIAELSILIATMGGINNV